MGQTVVPYIGQTVLLGAVHSHVRAQLGRMFVFMFDWSALMTSQKLGYSMGTLRYLYPIDILHLNWDGMGHISSILQICT
jgi:hypothetical protein